MIELHDVSLTLGGSQIIRSLDWSINYNEKWALFGRNGSGKTKILELITGYAFPTTGSIHRFGKPHRGTDIRQIRKRFGYLGSFLRERFHPSESIIDVVLSGLFSTIGLYDPVTPGDRQGAGELLERFNLSHRADDPIRNFSDGEKQKILLLRAMIHQPDLLILDEPAANLDLPSREDLLETLTIMGQDTSCSMIYVTHHTEEIIPLFEKICILESGSAVFQGPTGKGLTSERLSSLFGREVRVHPDGGRYYTHCAPSNWTFLS